MKNNLFYAVCDNIRSRYNVGSIALEKGVVECRGGVWNSGVSSKSKK